jgi:histidyl-tRNA synthetase
MEITNSKPPKGTIDLYGTDYDDMSKYKSTLEKLFVQNGGIGLETPVFEQRENLMGKYGDEAETKLVFNLETCGSEEAEKYTLRYDLTIPKVRFIQSKSIDKARIYSIGKVYRRDNPSLGRYREFYQADFDIVGEDSSSLINEMMLLKMAVQFVAQNNLGNPTILINHTENLKHLLINLVKIPETKFKSVCSSIDKLDKMVFDDIVGELKSKGLDDAQIEILKTHMSNPNPSNPETGCQIDKLVRMSKPFGFDSNIKFTPWMARGLDYYNGMIWEIVLDGFKSTIISGGRYDGLVKGVSLVGISFGLSRIMDWVNQVLKKDQIKNQVQTNKLIWKPIYMLTTISNSIDLETKINVLAKLELKFNTCIMTNSELKEKKLVKTITWCAQNYIKYLFVIAPDELALNKVILKDLESQTQELVDLD